jgi:methyltransferase-like protein 6
MITEKLAELVQGAGFEVVENGYVQKETVNVKEGISAPRVFIQGRFLKPPYHGRQTK